MNSYTQVDDDIIQCDDCGAFSYSKETVVHHKTCKPGESEHWEKLMSDFYDEDCDDSDIPY